MVSGPRPDLTIAGGLEPGATTAPAPRTHRAAYFPEARGYVQTPVYDRYALGPGASLEGPAIVEEREATTVIGPGAVVTVDAQRTLIAEPAGAETR